MPTKRILIAVSGLSPQVITETLFALAVRPSEGRAAWVPDEIHVITTLRGRENARLSLISNDPGWFHRLRSDYALPPIDFRDDYIHVIRDASGKSLEDIQTESDNRYAADAIAEFVRRQTDDPDSEVHASIAGGRKTMGFFLGYAMSLFGRPQDRLSHVLVSAPYENNRAFFYPTNRTQPIPRSNGSAEMIDAALAEVWLGEIPFVRLRSALPPDGGRQANVAFEESVAHVQELVNPVLRIDIGAHRVIAGDRLVPIRRADLAFLLWAAERRHQGRVLRRHKVADDAAVTDGREFAAAYSRLCNDPDDSSSATHRRVRHGLLHDVFDERLSGVKRAFEHALGAGRAEQYRIRRQGAKGHSHYALSLPPHNVQILEKHTV